MTYRVLVGEQKSLVFPVMCYGHLTIDYEREVADANANTITSDDSPYGIFGHDDSFTIQTILTPYDVNGLGETIEDLNNASGNHGILDSIKTLPSTQIKPFTVGSTTISEYHKQSTLYLPINRRKDYEMMIFYNTNVQLSLLNDTSGSSSYPSRNQPAEYKIKFSVIADGASDTLTSNKVIKADVGYTSNSGTITTTDGYTENNVIEYEEIATVYGNFGGDDTKWQMNNVTPENQQLALGENIYIRNGQTYTKVATTTTTLSLSDAAYMGVTYESGKGLSDVSSKAVYREAKKEALYLEKNHHICAIFDKNSGRMAIYYDGSLVASKNHSQYPITTFNFDRSDCYIGAHHSAGITNSWDRKQFMGELYELFVVDGIDNGFLTLETLMPNYRNTLLYYRFEEDNL